MSTRLWSDDVSGTGIFDTGTWFAIDHVLAHVVTSGSTAYPYYKPNGVTDKRYANLAAFKIGYDITMASPYGYKYVWEDWVWINADDVIWQPPHAAWKSTLVGWNCNDGVTVHLEVWG